MIHWNIPVKVFSPTPMCKTTTTLDWEWVSDLEDQEQYESRLSPSGFYVDVMYPLSLVWLC